MRSLQTCAQATAVAGSAMWCPMCEARGEKIVRSVPALAGDPQLVALDRLPDLVVADLRRGRHRQRRVLQPGELGVPVLLEGGRRRRVVAVAIDDHLRVSCNYPGLGRPEPPGSP
jgi:hypothetical protein